MNTVNTDIAPSWFPSETPEERVYWYSGYTIKDDLPLRGELQWEVCDTEDAAWACRLREKHDPTMIEDAPRPYPRTREEVIADCKQDGECSLVVVVDEHGNIVEEWTV